MQAILIFEYLSIRGIKSKVTDAVIAFIKLLRKDKIWGVFYTCSCNLVAGFRKLTWKCSAKKVPKYPDRTDLPDMERTGLTNLSGCRTKCPGHFCWPFTFVFCVKMCQSSCLLFSPTMHDQMSVMALRDFGTSARISLKWQDWNILLGALLLPLFMASDAETVLV